MNIKQIRITKFINKGEFLLGLVLSTIIGSAVALGMGLWPGFIIFCVSMTAWLLDGPRLT